MSSIENEIKDLLIREASAIRSIPVTGNYEKVVEPIHRRVHVKGGKVIASGMGKAGHVANHVATTLVPRVPRLFLFIPARHNMATWG